MMDYTTTRTANWKMQLDPYQRTGYKFLASRKRALLADEPGLGKSAQAVVACDELCADQILVLGTAASRPVWTREFPKWSIRDREIVVIDSGTVKIPDRKCLVISSYELACRLSEPLMKRAWDVLILDESHYLNNRKATRTKRVYGHKCDAQHGFSSRADYAWNLTGTPMTKDPSGLWPMFHAHFPEVIKNRNGDVRDYWSYVWWSCDTYQGPHGVVIKGGRAPAMSTMKERFAPHMLRRKAKDVRQELPTIRHVMLPVNVNKAEIEKLARDEHMKKLMAALEQATSDKERLSILLRMEGSLEKFIRKATGMAKVPGVIEWVKDILEGGLQKIVVFAYHTEVINQLTEALKEYNPQVIVGGTSNADRTKAENNFQTNESARVFIGNILAAGTSITLTAAHMLVMVEADWLPGNNEQAVKRIDRLGQELPCTAYWAHAPNTVDERLTDILRRRTADIQAMF